MAHLSLLARNVRRVYCARMVSNIPLNGIRYFVHYGKAVALVLVYIGSLAQAQEHMATMTTQTSNSLQATHDKQACLNQQQDLISRYEILQNEMRSRNIELVSQMPQSLMIQIRQKFTGIKAAMHNYLLLLSQDSPLRVELRDLIDRAKSASSTKECRNKCDSINRLYWIKWDTFNIKSDGKWHPITIDSQLGTIYDSGRTTHPVMCALSSEYFLSTTSHRTRTSCFFGNSENDAACGLYCDDTLSSQFSDLVSRLDDKFEIVRSSIEDYTEALKNLESYFHRKTFTFDNNQYVATSTAKPLRPKSELLQSYRSQFTYGSLNGKTIKEMVDGALTDLVNNNLNSSILIIGPSEPDLSLKGASPGLYGTQTVHFLSNIQLWSDKGTPPRLHSIIEPIFLYRDNNFFRPVIRQLLSELTPPDCHRYTEQNYISIKSYNSFLED